MSYRETAGHHNLHGSARNLLLHSGITIAGCSQDVPDMNRVLLKVPFGHWNIGNFAATFAPQ
jgi:hypothetical protein